MLDLLSGSSAQAGTDLLKAMPLARQKTVNYPLVVISEIWLPELEAAEYRITKK